MPKIFIQNGLTELIRSRNIWLTARYPSHLYVGEIDVDSSRKHLQLIGLSGGFGLVGLALASCVGPPADSATRPAQQPYVAVNLKQPAVLPQASSHGSFVIANGCVAFRRTGTGTLLTPIFPRGTRLVTDRGGNPQLIVKTSTVTFDREYDLGGGEVNVETFKEVELAAPAPASCPKSFYVIGSIKHE